MLKFTCEYCKIEGEAERPTRRFCSQICSQRLKRGWPKRRACRHCGAQFEVKSRADANRQHCSRKCAVNANYRAIRTWESENPETVAGYRLARLERKPTLWREKAAAERAEILALLGGGCVVCGVDNPHWLHVDFIPATRGARYRHPRHIAYIRRHLSFFRLLCANHHYELTLTGRIAGTDITQ